MASTGGNEDWVTVLASACRASLEGFTISQPAAGARSEERNLVRYPAGNPCSIADPCERLSWIAPP